MPFLTVGADRFHYVERGSGRPLLLVHGFPLDHTMWSKQLETLSSHCRLIAPDLRGFGRSAVTDGTVTMEQYADDLAGLLDGLGIREPVIFCGLSMGGYIAWQFWQRHQARLASLILCDTRAEADNPEAARGRLAVAEKVLSQGPTVLVESFLGKLFAEETLNSNREVVEAMKKVIMATSPQGIAAGLRGMAERPDMTSALAQLDVPVLAVCGEHDVITKSAEMRRMAAAILHAQFFEIPKAGHMSPLEQPNSVNSAIVDFLKR
jgi:3-oxoadipate enol-lactonase